MKNIKTSLTVYGICQAFILLIALVPEKFSFSYDTGFAIGFTNLLGGILLFVISIILFIIKNNDAGRAVLTAAGLLLLTGTITCSFFPFRLYH